MISHLSPQPQKRSGLPQLLVICLLFSLLLHLLFLWLIPKYKTEHEPIPTTPTYVTLEDRPATPEQTPRKMELDETPLPDQTPPVKTDRMAEADQKVEQEMAPRGEDSRDKPAAQDSPELETAKPASKPTPREQAQKPEKSATVTEDRKPEETGILPPSTSTPLDNKLSIKNLTRPAPDTLARLARNEQRERIKKRDDVLEGDAVYLNLRHDFLISFFQRFSNRVEANWNYPIESARRNEQGILLLKITVTQEGKLVDVDLLESSGSDALDFEAIQAVYRAAPFGPITRHWPHEQMKIYAYFQYTLTNRYIFGE